MARAARRPLAIAPRFDEARRAGMSGAPEAWQVLSAVC